MAVVVVAAAARTDQHSDRGPFNFKAHVPNVAPGAKLRIVGPDDQSWERSAPSQPPRFVRADARLTLGPSTRLVMGGARRKVTCRSRRNGRTIKGEHWHGLAVRLEGREAVLPLTGLPAGRVGVRLLAHDGFFTAQSEVLYVELPERAPEVAILHSRERTYIARRVRAAGRRAMPRTAQVIRSRQIDSCGCWMAGR